MKTVWLPLAAAMVFAQPSLAASPARSQRMPQEGTNAGQASPSQMPAATTQHGKMSEAPKMSEGSLSVKQQLKENLIRSGFTNVTVMPESFVIHATDPQGNPIAMVVSPDTLAAVEVTRGSNKMMSGRSVGEREPKFFEGAVRDASKENLADTQVQSSDHKNAGTIKGIVIGENGELSYLITTPNGHDVAINPDVIALNYDEHANTWNASVDATLNQIQSAPQAQLQ
jgi:hypothetical protein